MSVNHRLGLLLLAFCSVELVAFSCQASAFARGAYYRLGEDDPDATPGVLGNDPTVDSFIDHLNLARFDSPRYSSNVPVLGPDSKISMQFGATGGPTFPGYYGRTDSLSMVEQGYVLETWVLAAPTNLDAGSVPTALIAYNGTPGTNGFGFFQSGENYVTRIGSFDRILGPAETSVWHHLAYVFSFGNEGYYYDGQLVLQTNKDPIASAASGGFWLGGATNAALPAVQDYAFSGWIDEVRYQSFNPIAAGAFNPTNFLITVPEPSTWAINTDGKWFTPGNWIGGVPSGSGKTVQFIGATLAEVNVDSPVTVGRIFFDAGAAVTNYALSGSAITLNNLGGTGSGALIDVVSGSHTISASIILNDNASITGSGTLNLSGGISGNHTLTILGNLSAISINVDTLTIGTTGAAVVPEPSILTLLGAGVLGLIASVWRRNSKAV